MKKYNEIKNICNEIFSCTKCPHMKCDGYVETIDNYGNIEELPFRPDIAEYNIEKLKNYELMVIGINPGGKPKLYKKVIICFQILTTITNHVITNTKKKDMIKK